MILEDIPRDQWVSVLASISRQYRGWPVSILLGSQDDQGQPVARDLPLMGVEYEVGEGIRILLGEQPEAHVAHLVSDPSRLAVLITGDGGYEGLHIQSSDDGATQIRFREPVRPETMDGVGPRHHIRAAYR